MAQTVDSTLELVQDTFAPSAHPPVALPPDARLLSADASPVLGFAPAPTAPAGQSAPAELPAPLNLPAPLKIPAPISRPRRRVRLDWYEIAVIMLLVSSGALCIYRLLWAIQP